MRRICIVLAVVSGLAHVGCNGGPTPPTTTSVATTSVSTTSSVSTTTTSISSTTLSAHYIGQLAQAPPAPPLPLDLSLFFNLPGGGIVVDDIRPFALYQVNGGYNTGPGGITGSITGTLDGSVENGTFSGMMTANLPNGCVGARNYQGQLTRESLNWLPGTTINNCGGASPLTERVNPPAAPPNNPPTTSVPSTSTTSIPTTTTVGSSSSTTTTTIPTTTVATTTIPTTTTTSSTTTISTTTTTVCAYSISPGSVSIGAGAASGTVTVTATAGCGWSVGGSGFISASGSGTGSGSFTWSVPANTGPARSGGVPVTGAGVTLTFTVNQAAGTIGLARKR